jgi:hypothetical protein
MSERVYRHTPDMGEISGFARSGIEGGERYEQTCQDMLEVGCKWLEAHPDAVLEVATTPGIYGYLESGTDDARVLERVVIDAAEPYGATGAMHETVMVRLVYIHKHGWEAYRTHLEEANAQKIK